MDKGRTVIVFGADVVTFVVLKIVAARSLLPSAVFDRVTTRETADTTVVVYSHSHRNHARVVSPGARTLCAKLNASGGPDCGSMQVACAGSS